MLMQFSKEIIDKTPTIYGIVQKGGIQYIVSYMIDSKYRTSVKLSNWIKNQVSNPTKEVQDLTDSIETDTDYDKQMFDILVKVRSKFKYVTDDVAWKMPEKWQTVTESVTKMTGDCFAGYEEIYTPTGIKKIKDIKVGDIVLSYDFKKQKYANKKVTAFWNKGKLQLNKIHFRNGQTLDVSENHPMWHKIKNNTYEKKYLSQIDLNNYIERKVPIAKKIPYIKSTPKFDKDLYIVLGHFLAEGFVDKYKVDSSGHELIEHIIPLLEKHNIPFTEYKNNSEVPCIRFLKSEFKEYLKLQKQNSFDIHITEDILTLPEDYLKALLYGMWLGDGTKYQYPDKRGYKNSKEWTYSTSSKQLAEDIQRIGLYLGKPCHIWKQEKHGGVGTKPIYRINYNSNSHFVKDYGYKDISEVSISFIEKLNSVEMFDLTVEDTHTVIMKNGIITHQCEDGAILMYVIARLKGVPANRLTIFAGSVLGGGHCWLGYKPNGYPLNYAFLDWCYWPKLLTMTERNLFTIIKYDIYEYTQSNTKVKSNYYTTWFGFNEDSSFTELKYTFFEEE